MRFFVRIAGRRTYLWRAVDDEGEVLEVLAQSRRNKSAAVKLMRKLLKKQGYIPDGIVTDKLGSYSAALRELGLARTFMSRVVDLTIGLKFCIHCPAVVCLQNHERRPTRRRERRMGRFKSPGSIQRFLSVCSRCHLQSLQFATSSDLSPNSPSNARQSICGVD